MKENAVVDKSFAFAIKVVSAYKLLSENKEFVLSKQLLRAGTSIGANVREGVCAQSRADFVSKMSIALKECHETGYWLDLLYKSEFLSEATYAELNTANKELFALLTSIIKSTKSNSHPNS